MVGKQRIFLLFSDSFLTTGLRKRPKPGKKTFVKVNISRLTSWLASRNLRPNAASDSLVLQLMISRVSGVCHLAVKWAVFSLNLLPLSYAPRNVVRCQVHLHAHVPVRFFSQSCQLSFVFSAGSAVSTARSKSGRKRRTVKRTKKEDKLSVSFRSCREIRQSGCPLCWLALDLERAAPGLKVNRSWTNNSAPPPTPPSQKMCDVTVWLHEGNHAVQSAKGNRKRENKPQNSCVGFCALGRLNSLLGTSCSRSVWEQARQIRDWYVTALPQACGYFQPEDKKLLREVGKNGEGSVTEIQQLLDEVFSCNSWRTIFFARSQKNDFYITRLSVSSGCWSELPEQRRWTCFAYRCEK